MKRDPVASFFDIDESLLLRINLFYGLFAVNAAVNESSSDNSCKTNLSREMPLRVFIQNLFIQKMFR